MNFTHKALNTRRMHSSDTAILRATQAREVESYCGRMIQILRYFAIECKTYVML